MRRDRRGNHGTYYQNGDPWRGFAAAVLLQARRDWLNMNRGKKQAAWINRQEMIDFFRGRWFILLCDLIDMEPNIYLKKLQIPTNILPEKWSTENE